MAVAFVDLMAGDNFQPWSLEINPRGLVPVLVHDGVVHIESNDIVQISKKPSRRPSLYRRAMRTRSRACFGMRTISISISALSFRFVFDPPGPPKSAAMLESYAANGTGTVGGAKDGDKATQIAFWQRAAKEGFTDRAARASGQKFRAEFDALDQRLAQQPYLMGES